MKSQGGGGVQDIRARAAKKTGKLKIFFGYAPGVGKTYAMLDDARSQLKSRVDVVVGYLEPHTGSETIQLLDGLPALPPKTVNHKNRYRKEFDLDAALQRKPELLLVDVLAHNNADGMRNKKRYQDIEELLNAGINVYTTVNVQHIESLRDLVQDITKVNEQDTIPDYMFDSADKVELIDIEPDELMKRYAEKKCPLSLESLRLLRETAMRKVTDRIVNENQNEQLLSAKTAGIKLLVCISSSPSAAKCIRWTARSAEAFHAPWTALYIEDMESRYFTEEEKKNVQENLDLAELLGAKIVTLNGHGLASIIAEYARLIGITNIVIGKSRNKRTLKTLFDPALEDKLIGLLPNIEIHIIPSSGPRRSYREPRRKRISKDLFLSWPDIWKTIGGLTGATLLSFGLRALEFGNQNIIMVYILSVFFISRLTMGYVYGITASVLSVLVFNFFFVSPLFTFYAIQTGYPVTFVIMLVVALITSTTTVRIQTQARLAAEREGRTELLYEINKRLLTTRGLQHIVTLTNEYIVKLFKCSAVFYTRDQYGSANLHRSSSHHGSSGILTQSPAEPDASFLLSERESKVAQWVFTNQKQAGAGTDTHIEAGAYYMPIISQGDVLGVVGISCLKGRLSRNNRLLLKMIISQVAMALERQYLSDEQRQILIESEKEKMRSNLLRAISHDLRTPLTGILGASSAILENGDHLDKETHIQLVSNIKEDSQWLIRMVENLLSVTRIKEGTMNVAKTFEAAEEIVAEAISRTRHRYPDRKIAVQVPEDLLLVPMDGKLIEQVLINLFENAVKHSPDDAVTAVRVTKAGAQAVFEVSDNGPGVAEEDFPYLFESYVPCGKRSSDSARGMGIGLSICMSIIKAHNGKMEAANKEQGGAVFRFTLPLEEENIYE
ncbi:MAG: sensor histidine kinase KdpD [Dehalobacter sp. 4CP]|uniref:DUF4118 domain-containing protein n=1 Tax=Dehalobacter sp. CP TaxID=2594474 RepID=UPI0013CCDCB0|nr:sensor histidine kinase KdpD [Dehalobacter sp. 4CP]